MLPPVHSPTTTLPYLPPPAQRRAASSSCASSPSDASGSVARAAPHASTEAGRAGFERLVEQERGRIDFDIDSPAALRALLQKCAQDFASSCGKTRLAVISGGGIVGYLAAIHLRLRYGFNVLVVERRACATRKNVLELKRFTLKEWPAELIALLVKHKFLTRSACRIEKFGLRAKVRPASAPRSLMADLAEPCAQRNRKLIPLARPMPAPLGTARPEWLYPDPALESEADFYDTYALGQTCDLQVGMSRFCRQVGIHLAHGEICELERERTPAAEGTETQDGPAAGEYLPGIRLDHPAMRDGVEPIRPPPGLPTVVAVAEGNSPRLHEGFGGADTIEVDEQWLQRNYTARWVAAGHTDQGGSAIDVDQDSGSVVITQVWNGPDGLQANVSVMQTPAQRARVAALPPHQAKLYMDSLFERACALFQRFKLPIEIDLEHETFRSPPIPVTLTRARNPVHGNVIFLGDASGLGSPFNSRGANDGATGQIRILADYINDPGYLAAEPALRREAEDAARARFNSVFRTRHGYALDLMLKFGFYTPEQVAQIDASFRQERRLQ